MAGKLWLDLRHLSRFIPTAVDVSLKTFSFGIMEMSANWEPRGYSGYRRFSRCIDNAPLEIILTCFFCYKYCTNLSPSYSALGETSSDYTQRSWKLVKT